MRGLLLLGLCGCSSIFGLEGPHPLGGDAGHDDAPADGSYDAADGTVADAQQCFGTGEYTVCLDALPAGDASLMGPFSTAASNAMCVTSAHWTSPDQPAACFVVGAHVTIGSVTATGARPLVIVATDTITFSGLVDVSSHIGDANTGAGFAIASCASPGDGSMANEGGGGGAGGSFATLGGTGGTGQNAAPGGTPAPMVAIGALHGGCPGGLGAKGGGGNPATPGAGGGALYAVAGSTISLGGAAIAANGAGATAPQNRWGGSGGGAGGMIVLYAPSITSTAAILVANGGGGASGADSGQGIAGDDPSPAAPTTPASGGTKSGAGAGGNGFAGAMPAASGGAPLGMLDGGGGGGGGAGYIRANVPLTGVTGSPTVVVTP